jgi:hypothetical protein
MHGAPKLLVMLTLFGVLPPATVRAQRFTPPPFGSNLDLNRSRIGDERVQRQSEVMRLQRLLDAFETRVTRLERHQMRSSQMPAVTIAEAEATVEFAKTQLKESEYRLERGEVTEVDVAADKLALTRAQGQLDAASAAYQENILVLEMDVVYAQRQLLKLRQEKELAERLTAKGYTSSDALKNLILDEELAEKELRLAKLRLETQRKAAGVGTAEKKSNETSVPSPPDPAGATLRDQDLAAPTTTTQTTND